MRSVSDSNTLIGLAKGEVFSVLRDLYDEIVVPQAVWDEVVTSGAGRYGAAETAAAREEGWLVIQDPATLGESNDATVLSLALEVQGRLLTSDRQLSLEAARLQVPVVDCTEVVLFAHLDGLIPSCLRTHASPTLRDPRGRGGDHPPPGRGSLTGAGRGRAGDQHDAARWAGCRGPV